MARNISAGVTRTLSKESTDNPKLCAKRLSDGRLSLYLNYYLGYHKEIGTAGEETIKAARQKVSLNLYLFDSPRTPEERQHNKDVSELAKRIRYEREQEMKAGRTGYRIQRKKDADFLEFFREYMANYTKKDYRSVRVAYSRFVDFLKDTPKYNALANRVRPSQIDKDMMTMFVEYLQKRSYGEGAASIYSRFKKVVINATEHDLFAANPCHGVSIRRDKNSVTKAILSFDEIRVLAATPFQGRDDIRRAFLFSLLTGMRWCDVRDLTFGNVDFANGVLSFTQSKTAGHSASAAVTIPMTADTLALVGERGGSEEKIFNLPSYELSSRYVKMWVKKSGIEKNISWHCARHSFAVNVLSNGANIKTVSSLLGHSSIAMTEKYLHVIDSQKRQAVESLPTLNL